MNNSLQLNSFLVKNKNGIDSDQDGLSDNEEKLSGSNLNSVDTDSGDLFDYAEVNIFKTDPNNPDTDSNGFKDGEEIMYGYDPTKKDMQFPTGHPSGSAG